MHETICFGVLCKSHQTHKKEKSQQIHKYMTRSAHCAKHNNDLRGLTISDVETTMNSQILNNVRDWINNPNNDENIDNDEPEEQQLNYNECKSPVTTFSRVSSRINEQFSETEKNNDIDVGINKKTINRLKPCTAKTGILYEDDEKSCESILGNYGELINCPDKSCNFNTTSMQRLLEHDLTVHDELSLFPFKCGGGRFLGNYFLEEHLSCQNPGLFVCSKCERIFNFEHQLKYHLIKNEIADSKKKSKHCKVCNLTFAQSSYYCNHIISIKHIEKKRQKVEQNIPRIYYKNSSFNIGTDNKEIITLNRLKLPTKEIKIVQYAKPFKRRQEVAFRQWKPHLELMRLN